MENSNKEVEKVFRVKLSKEVLEDLDALIRSRAYVTYAEALRHAIRLLIEKEKSLLK
jgi:Arc/MetJ-type ribon-helix-helix transcriptional regulator